MERVGDTFGVVVFQDGGMETELLANVSLREASRKGRKAKRLAPELAIYVTKIQNGKHNKIVEIAP